MKNISVNRLFLLLTVILSIGIIAFLGNTGCNNSESISFEAPSFNELYNEITYFGPANTWSAVVFQHKEHSDRYGSTCVKCHNCVPGAGNSKWNCRSCHNTTESQSICIQELVVLGDADHSCTYLHCYKCHEVAGDNPGHTGTANCIYCHKEGIIGPLTVNPILQILSTNRVKVTFSKVVDQTSAEDYYNNYMISIKGAAAVHVWSAHQKNNIEVELDTPTISGLTSGQTVVVEVTGVIDLNEQPIEDNNSTNVAKYTQP